MRRLSYACLVTITLSALAGCTRSGETGGPLTKDQARASSGKADDGTDYCELYGWYGDGVCDDFCPSPDPDCDACAPVVCTLACEHGFERGPDGCEICSCAEPPGGTCPPVVCTLACEHGFERGPDGCEICACSDPGDGGTPPPSMCPDEEDPGVEYHSCFTTDVWECPPGSTRVIDPEGCGCYCAPVAS